MKIRISKDWWTHYVRRQPGKTQAEKECHAERIFSSPGRNWGKGMNAIKGNWIEVETEFLFEDQFNISNPDLRVYAKDIDGIDFSPEFDNLDEYRQAVQKRYNKDWPGSKVTCSVLAHYIKQGFIKDMTPIFEE